MYYEPLFWPPQYNYKQYIMPNGKMASLYREIMGLSRATTNGCQYTQRLIKERCKSVAIFVPNYPSRKCSQCHSGKKSSSKSIKSLLKYRIFCVLSSLTARDQTETQIVYAKKTSNYVLEHLTFKGLEFA